MRIEDSRIFIVSRPDDARFLRATAKPAVFEANGSVRFGDELLSKKQVDELIHHMKHIMREANGVGLSANQIGLPYRLFVASVHTTQGEPRSYAILNPVIEKSGSGTAMLEEGCLSIPDVYGDVPRARQVVLKGFDKRGAPVKIKAWDLLARVFQHEIDHLDGKVFTDRTKVIRRMEPPPTL